MSTTNVDRYAHVLGFMGAADAWLVGDYGKYMAESVVLQFNDAEPVVGLEQVKKQTARSRAILKSRKHELVESLEDEAARKMVVEAVVHYTLLDDREISFSAVTIVHFDVDELIDGYRIYADVPPLSD